METNCPNCGAPLVGGWCGYCGTLSPESEERIQMLRRLTDERMTWPISYTELLSCNPCRYIPQDTQKKE